MKKTSKFYLIIFLLIFSSFTLVNSQSLRVPSDLSDRMPVVPINYEENYSNGVCSGTNNIVMAGCTVIAGQIVRSVPAMVFGASFDNMKKCVKENENFRNNNQEIDLNNICNAITYLNPEVDKSGLVFTTSGSDGFSALAMTNYLYNINSEIAKNSFDNTYFVYKSVENIPVAKEVFAQQPSTQDLWFMGEFWRDTAFNLWKNFRNVAYAMIGLLSIVLGLTLMSSNSFLDNNAKWRLSLEQAIPRVIISVILIQFSYTIGEALLYIHINEGFAPLILYMFGGIEGSLVVNVLQLIIAIIFVFFLSANPVGAGIIILMCILGIWCLYRLIVLWWMLFTNLIGIFVFTFASPVLIAASLLPGEAGALQIRRYFSTLVALVSRSFLLQAIRTGPLIYAALIYNWGSTGYGAMFGAIGLAILSPLVVSIIIYQYADNTEQWANTFAKNVTGAEPIGSSSKSGN